MGTVSLRRTSHSRSSEQSRGANMAKQVTVTTNYAKYVLFILLSVYGESLSQSSSYCLYALRVLCVVCMLDISELYGVSSFPRTGCLVS